MDHGVGVSPEHSPDLLLSSLTDITTSCITSLNITLPTTLQRRLRWKQRNLRLWTRNIKHKRERKNVLLFFLPCSAKDDESWDNKQGGRSWLVLCKSNIGPENYFIIYDVRRVDVSISVWSVRGDHYLVSDHQADCLQSQLPAQILRNTPPRNTSDSNQSFQTTNNKWRDLFYFLRREPTKRWPRQEKTNWIKSE